MFDQNLRERRGYARARAVEREQLRGQRGDRERDRAVGRVLDDGHVAVLGLAHRVLARQEGQHLGADEAREALDGPAIGAYLRQVFPAAADGSADDRDVDGLIAGCGTGQQAVETAERFRCRSLLACRRRLKSRARRSRSLSLLTITRSS